jgi:VCBS repeat-containing protein
VQAVVDAYNAIKANADTAGTANATQEQYAAIGVNGIDNAAKTSLLGDVVDTKAFGDVDTVAKVQALANLAAVVINSAGTGTAPTKEQLEALGITGVTDANLADIQAAIAATADDGTGVDTLSELQAVANAGATNAANAAAAAAALSTIAAAAQANDATNTNVAASVFATAGVTGVDSTNVAAIQSALNSAAVVGTSVDTLGEVQAVVDAYKAILAEANDTANTAGNGTADANPASNPTAAQYAAIGVNLGSATTDAATDPETLALLNAIVGGKQAADVGTVADVQALATIANAIQLQATGVTPNPALTIADLQKIGLDTTGVTTNNLPALLAAIALKNDNGSETDTLEKLQALIGTLDKVAPVAVNDTSSATEDALIQTGNVKTNDTSLDTTETFAIVGSNVGSYGTLVLTSSGAYTYTYNTGIIHAITTNVTDTFTYRVTDAAGNTSTATLDVTVTPVNDAATFSGDISKATFETNVAQTITGQLNVADIDSATTVVVQTNVAGSAGLGKFTINTAGAWSYVMDSAQNQLKPADVITDSLTVSTADGTTQIISVVITGTNDAPIVANALADTTATATVAITNYVVPANAFSDVDSTSLTYTATLADGSALSTVGLSFDATTRTVSGTPSAGTAGSTLSVKVTASDGSLSAFDTFDIVVASPDSIAPTLLSSSPADNGTVAYANVANDLTLTFSEAVQKGTGLIELYNASNTLVESFDVATSTKVTGWNGSTLTINPTANLAAGTGYYVKVATTAIKDLANNAYAGITDATTLNFTVSAGAGSVINLGADGKLIAPVQVEGKWYYYWDRTGDGASGITDRVTHDVLDTIFKYDLNGAERPVGVTDTNDVYRYATINGVQVSLPTLNGNMSYPLTGVNTAAVGGGATNSSTYDELSAVWDNFPYSPTWYTDGVYWSATKAPGQYHDAISMADGSNYGTATGTADTNAWWVALQVVAANAAPVLADTVLTLTGVSAGAAAPVNGNTTAGDLVSTLVGGITDADAGATKGIAITGVHSNGTLYYSVDGGTTWLTATGVSDTNALLLAADSNTRVYYKANGTTGTISDAITFRAWDMTANITEGVYTSTAANGGKAQFSELSDTVSVQVVKPVTINNVSTDNIIVLNESIPLTGTANANATVNLSINGTARSVVADASGNWSYDTKSVDLVRYVMVRKPLNGTGGAYDPNGIFSIDELKVMVNGVDVAAGKQVRIGTGTTSAGFVNYLTDGTTGYFETGPGTATDAWVEIDLGAQYRVDSVYVTPRTGWSMRLNDAKVFTGLTEQYGASTARLISTGNSTITNVASTDNTPVSVVQPNGGDKDPINVGANTITATQTVSGVTSNASKTVTSKNTIGIIDTYLNATDKYVHDGELICGDTTPLLRGVLEAPLTGTQKVAIWSTTGGVAAQVNYATVNGVYWEFQLPALTVGTHTYEALLVASPGGVQLATSYTYTVVVGSTPLALDLNGDGVQTLGLDAGVQFDLLNTGKKVNVGWVSQQDGLLAMDINGDGAINSGAELFGEQTVLADGTLAKNGWEALAAQDTNADGTIDAQDANFNQLRVWVDADSDGTTDAGELRALADESITSISLNHDNSSVQQNGNVVEMASTFTTTDGAVHTVADVGFQVQNATSSVFKLTSGNTLDLSGLGNASLVNTIDMATDAAANTVKLSLADVLSVATDASIANGVHKLTLTGDANDTVELDLSQWANTGNTVTEGDHTYAVYNASSAAAAQLLIDQHMVLANHG